MWLGNRRLKNHGGPGDPRVGRIGRHVVTVVDALERAIAKSTVEAVELQTGRRLHELPLIAFLQQAERRTGGRPELRGRVMAEIGSLHAQAREAAGNG